MMNIFLDSLQQLASSSQNVTISMTDGMNKPRVAKHRAPTMPINGPRFGMINAITTERYK